MYQKGEVKRVISEKKCKALFYSDNIDVFEYTINENLLSLINDEHDQYILPCVYLPHSCDEWIIGGKKEVELMINDLQEMLKELEEVE